MAIGKYQTSNLEETLLPRQDEKVALVAPSSLPTAENNPVGVKKFTSISGAYACLENLYLNAGGNTLKQIAFENPSLKLALDKLSTYKDSEKKLIESLKTRFPTLDNEALYQKLYQTDDAHLKEALGDSSSETPWREAAMGVREMLGKCNAKDFQDNLKQIEKQQTKRIDQRFSSIKAVNDRLKVLYDRANEPKDTKLHEGNRIGDLILDLEQNLTTETALLADLKKSSDKDEKALLQIIYQGNAKAVGDLIGDDKDKLKQIINLRKTHQQYHTGGSKYQALSAIERAQWERNDDWVEADKKQFIQKGKEDEVNFFAALTTTWLNGPLLASMATMVSMVKWGSVFSVASNIPIIGGIVAGLNAVMGVVKLAIMGVKKSKGRLDENTRKTLILDAAASFLIGGIILAAAVLSAAFPIAFIVVATVLTIGNIFTSVMKESLLPDGSTSFGRIFSTLIDLLGFKKKGKAFQSVMVYSSLCLLAAGVTAAALTIAGLSAAAAIAGPIGIIIAVIAVLTVGIYMAVQKAKHANKPKQAGAKIPEPAETAKPKDGPAPETANHLQQNIQQEPIKPAPTTTKAVTLGTKVEEENGSTNHRLAQANTDAKQQKGDEYPPMPE